MWLKLKAIRARRRYRLGAAVGQESRVSELILYDFGNSVCCQKVRITLRAKGLEWRAVTVDLFKSRAVRSEAICKLNPKGVVPTLVHDGKPVIESTLICEYIDETFPQRAKAHSRRSVAAKPHAAVEQDGRRGTVRGRHRNQLFGDVPRADEEPCRRKSARSAFAMSATRAAPTASSRPTSIGVQSPFVRARRRRV